MKTRASITLILALLIQTLWFSDLLVMFRIIPDQYFLGSMEKFQETRDFLNIEHNAAILIVCSIILICIDINIFFIKKIKPVFTKNMNLLSRIMPGLLFIMFIFSGLEQGWFNLSLVFLLLLLAFNELTNKTFLSA